MKFAAFAMFFAVAFAARAVDIVGYTSAANDRFSSGFATAPVPNANASFLGAGYDWSGVGWNPADAEQSFAMISDRFFVYAEHFAPGPTISFFTPFHTIVTANVSGTSFQATSTTLGRVGDLAIGMLSAPLDPGLGIASYPIFKLPTIGAYTGQHMLIYGHGATVTPVTSPRVGTNVFDGVTGLDENNDGLPDTEMLSFSNSGTPTGEAFLVPGDSGSPSFVAVDGQLALIGVHSDTALVGGVPTSFDAFVPDYLDSLTAHGVNFRVVPEPSASALLALGLGAGGGLRRWRGRFLRA